MKKRIPRLLREYKILESFSLFILVYSPSTGCGSVEAEFEALIGSDQYDVSYNWDFGNGFSSNQQFPPNQLYDQAGTYTVTLNTDITSFNYTLNNFAISSTDVDCWGFDFALFQIPKIDKTENLKVVAFQNRLLSGHAFQKIKR